MLPSNVQSVLSWQCIIGLMKLLRFLLAKTNKMPSRKHRVAHKVTLRHAVDAWRWTLFALTPINQSWRVPPQTVTKRQLRRQMILSAGSVALMAVRTVAPWLPMTVSNKMDTFDRMTPAHCPSFGRTKGEVSHVIGSSIIKKNDHLTLQMI